MAATPKQHSSRPKNRKYIEVNDRQELHKQSQYLGMSPEDVIRATLVVGTDMDAVAAYLGA